MVVHRQKKSTTSEYELANRRAAVLEGMVSRENTGSPLVGQRSGPDGNLQWMNRAPADDDDDDDDECCQLSPLTIALTIFGLIWAVGGTVFFAAISDGSPITGLYVVTQIITTVGYGDVLPQTSGEKMFVAFYVLVGAVVVAGLVGKVLDYIVDRAEDSFLDTLERLGDNDETTPPAGDYTKICVAAVLCCLFLVLGILIYGVWDGCQCSYGVTMVPGCVQERCKATGGISRSNFDSLYMSVVTLTTVGFGDESPKSKVGRVIGIVWMLLGFTAFANFVNEFSALVMANQKGQPSGMVMTEDLFARMDKDGSGFLTQYEFVNFILQKYSVVDSDTLDAITDQFDKLSAGKNSISVQDLATLLPAADA